MSVLPESISDLLNRIIDLSRIALMGNRRDIELSIKRLSKTIDKYDEVTSEKLRELLILRPNQDLPFRENSERPIPLDSESRLQLLRSYYKSVSDEIPIFDNLTEKTLERVIVEHSKRQELLSHGIDATNKLLFHGPPGVGKTMSAHWVSEQLKLPLLSVDLSVVMSSYLGKTGSNIRSIFDYTREFPCVLLLDELDSLAKKRDDLSDVGELKRLVTVLIQEIDDWPSNSVLIAATNHPKLLDHAIWRRFEIILEFPLPDYKSRIKLIDNSLSSFEQLERKDIFLFAAATAGLSQGELVRELTSFKRETIVMHKDMNVVLRDRVSELLNDVSKSKRREIAINLISYGFSQREVHRITGVSRDTIRKSQNIQS